MNAPSPAVRLDTVGAVATITLDRPAALNSLDRDTKSGLLQALRDVAADPEVRCVILAATGKAFCVGQDLREHAEHLQGDDPDLGRIVRQEYAPLVEAVMSMDKPVVAAVGGVAAGAGAGLALAADLRILADTASYAFAFTGIGLACDTGLSWILPRLVGLARAKELLFSPTPVPAEEALRLGLATEVVAAADLATHAAGVAERLAAGPTRSYGAIRRLLAEATTLDLTAALEAEADAMAATGRTQDHRDAVASFLAKERPTFTGR